ncbi:MAG: hypothetical protein AB7V43_06330 [Acidimicrobiia bacterium]
MTADSTILTGAQYTPFDLLGSASFLVEDGEATCEAMVSALGFPPPKPQWILPPNPYGLAPRFMRPTLDTVQCPTPIEVVQLTPPWPGAAADQVQIQIEAIKRSQGSRPVKVHATDVAAVDAMEWAGRFRHLGLVHWVHVSTEGEPRVWVGVDPDDRTRYDPSLDGHLHVEVLPTSVLRLRPETFEPPPFDAANAEPGTMVRVAWRTFLVADLDCTLATVERLLGWRSRTGVEHGDGGARRAHLDFRLPTSTRLELLQPATGSDEHAVLAEWGEGPWSMTIAVHDLEAKTLDLRRRGTEHAWVETGFATPQRIVRVARAATPGCAFDLVELASSRW